ncbi:shikimate dehydrogenase [Bifidobacterium tsurumiense]|uniref:shikimate dehydrogenase family protein n=1 Tax=Bifidobacterium tsurumiense TaxID=356829 RepID=UPI0012B1CB84|nr:shikimate dehydrogenase [Bifidobacterium tsurumiense]
MALQETVQRCAVLGQPIAHSLSPVLHMAAYQALGLQDWVYDRREVSQEQLPSFLRQLDANWRGLSLTMPLKQTILPFGHLRDAWSQELRVANTAVFDWNIENKPKINLYNTDVEGIVRAFEHAWQQYEALPSASMAISSEHSSRAAIIGNGNTASSAVAACTAMTQHGISSITVLARHPDKNPFISEIAARHGMQCEVVPLAQACEVLTSSAVVISTLPAHAADPIADALTSSGVKCAGSLLDVAYDPRPSRLLTAWESCGGLGIGGEEMLLYQAIKQVHLITGCEEALEFHVEQAMRSALEEAL